MAPIFSLLTQRFDGTWKFLTPATNREMATYLGLHWSRSLGRPIISIENRSDGTTVEFARFENGEIIPAEADDVAPKDGG